MLVQTTTLSKLIAFCRYVQSRRKMFIKIKRKNIGKYNTTSIYGKQKTENKSYIFYQCFKYAKLGRGINIYYAK